MTTATLSPTSTNTAGGWTRVGGSTVHGVLSDGDDATYMYDSTGANATCGMADTPAAINLAAIYEQWSLNARGRGAGSGTGLDVTARISVREVVQASASYFDTDSTIVANTTGQPAGQKTPSKTDIDNATLTLTTGSLQGPTNLQTVRIIEASLTLNYDPMPVPILHPGF